MRKKKIKYTCEIDVPSATFYSRDFQKNLGKYARGVVDYLYKKGTFTLEFSSQEQIDHFLNKMGDVYGLYV